MTHEQWPAVASAFAVPEVGAEIDVATKRATILAPGQIYALRAPGKRAALLLVLNVPSSTAVRCQRVAGDARAGSRIPAGTRFLFQHRVADSAPADVVCGDAALAQPLVPTAHAGSRLSPPSPHDDLCSGSRLHLVPGCQVDFTAALSEGSSPGALIPRFHMNGLVSPVAVNVELSPVVYALEAPAHTRCVVSNISIVAWAALADLPTSAPVRLRFATFVGARRRGREFLLTLPSSSQLTGGAEPLAQCAFVARRIASCARPSSDVTFRPDEPYAPAAPAVGAHYFSVQLVGGAPTASAFSCNVVATVRLRILRR